MTDDDKAPSAGRHTPPPPALKIVRRPINLVHKQSPILPNFPTRNFTYM